MTFNRRSLLAGVTALGGASFLPTIAHAKGQVIATTTTRCEAAFSMFEPNAKATSGESTKVVSEMIASVAAARADFESDDQNSPHAMASTIRSVAPIRIMGSQ